MSGLRDELSERLLLLRQQEQETFASLWAVRGAISELENTLQQLPEDESQEEEATE